ASAITPASTAEIPFLIFISKSPFLVENAINSCRFGSCLSNLIIPFFFFVNLSVGVILHKFSQKNSADHTINAKQKSVPARAETLPFSL
ncbi:MAG: hypothetical protein SO054_09460, partial [Ruminococcus callidus]|nr:hypothetical protein [Ruminococcus callidus]